MKKRIALFVSFLLLATSVLSACSSGTSSATPEAQPEGTQAEPAAQTDDNDGVEAAMGGEIVVATWAGDPFESAWKDKAAEFEAATGVRVVIDAVPWENLREKCVLELASGSGEYDVVYVHPSWFEEFANNGYLMPVSEYATDAELDLYVENLLEDYEREGVLYGLPDFIATQVLAYRTDIFAEEGLEAPESWDDILALCEALSGSDEYAPITFPAKKGGTLGTVFSAFLISNGGWYFDDNGEPAMQSDAALETAEFLGQLAQYQSSGYLNNHWDENSQIAGGGKAAMAVVITPNAAWLEDETTSATAGNWAYVPIQSNKGTPGGMVDNYCWSVVEGTANADAAGAFVKFITDTDAQIYFTEKTSTCGATKAYYANEELRESQPVLGAMQVTLTNTMPAPGWSTWAAEQEILEVNLQKVMSGEMDAADAMEAVQEKFMESR